MQPFTQEFDRIEHDLTQATRSLLMLIDDEGYDELIDVASHVGMAIQKLHEFKENDTRDGCHECSKPISNNYVVIDNIKYCSDCAKDIRRREKTERFK